MIDVKQAVEKSADYLRGIEFSAPQELRVEEVELSGDDGCWMITLGFRGDQLVADPDRKGHDGVFHPNDLAGKPIAYLSTTDCGAKKITKVPPFRENLAIRWEKYWESKRFILGARQRPKQLNHMREQDGDSPAGPRNKARMP